jgi:hypothetical protein
MHPIWPKLGIILSVACASEKSLDPDEPCVGNDSVTVQIGTGAGSEFYPLQPHDSVTLDVAPQGGYGVSIRALTTGLKADDVVDVLLKSEIGGAPTGEFLSEGMQLFCQEDGHGMLWGVVVGFDPDIFPDNDALLVIDGETADLIVEITDVNSETASAEVPVTIEAGG